MPPLYGPSNGDEYYKGYVRSTFLFCTSWDITITSIYSSRIPVKMSFAEPEKTTEETTSAETAEQDNCDLMDKVSYQCHECSEIFATVDNLKEHLNSEHGEDFNDDVPDIQEEDADVVDEEVEEVEHMESPHPQHM